MRCLIRLEGLLGKANGFLLWGLKAGGIGLVASAHLLAAAGGDGLLEVDANPNPLRAGLAAPFPAVADGRMVLPTGPGLGAAPAPEVERYRVA
jgi:L-alanine-DL-glutamate epimerase-like enolase superfamily enzyme